MISWFGYDIGDFELFEERDFRHHIHCVVQLARSMGLEVARLGGNLDLIIGKPVGSLYPRDFFRFQQEWDHLNARLGFRMSGLLWLKDKSDDDRQLPWEFYRQGLKTSGDSIGRPHRHGLPVTKH